jgi:hypothetical protein
MATVRGVLVRLDGDGVSLALGHEVLALQTCEDVPPSLRPGDEVAGWREGRRILELRLARIRTDRGAVTAGPAAGCLRLDTGLRVWELLAPDWPDPGWRDRRGTPRTAPAGTQPAGAHPAGAHPAGAAAATAALRVCHDGLRVLWAADDAGELWLPPWSAPGADAGHGGRGPRWGAAWRFATPRDAPPAAWHR